MRALIQMKLVLGMLLMTCLSCSDKTETSGTQTHKHVTEKANVAYKPTEKRVLYGDFNGDGKRDTLTEKIISYSSGLSIDSFPDPYKNEWDTVISHCYKNDYTVVLTSAMQNVDTLHLGSGIGFYCLINMGDINHDKKEEIALVVNRCDVTNVNQCFIYTVCGQAWVPLKIFYVFEFAFYGSDHEPPDPNHIKGYLEKRNGRWHYLDYIDDLQSENDSLAGILMPLKPGRCK